MTQDRTQAAGEGQALFLVDRNLRNAAQLIFDRIFNSDDLVFVGLDLVYGGVERGGLAASGRAGDQHHAVRLFDVAAKAAQVVFIKPDHVQCQRAELFRHRLFVQHTKHSILAMHRRHNAHAEVDGAAVVLHAETAVLRYAALGNVELAHDLDTRDNGGVMLLADRRHRLGEHAVNAELDAHRVVAGFDVNV